MTEQIYRHQIRPFADQVSIFGGAKSGQLDRALELVEQCRAVLFGDAWVTRRGWAKLLEIRPELAEGLSQVEKDLTNANAYSHVTSQVEVRVNTRTASAVDWDPRPQAVEQIRQLAARRDYLLERVRAMPGFEKL